MGSASQAIMVSANSCKVASSPSRLLFFSRYHRDPRKKQSLNLFRIRASSEESDCNVEECAPDKEVGKVSMEWLAVEKTKVVGTFPPRKQGWTGYVEKDTAGQTNIYSVENGATVVPPGLPGSRHNLFDVEQCVELLQQFSA